MNSVKLSGFGCDRATNTKMVSSAVHTKSNPAVAGDRTAPKDSPASIIISKNINHSSATTIRSHHEREAQERPKRQPYHAVPRCFSRSRTQLVSSVFAAVTVLVVMLSASQGVTPAQVPLSRAERKPPTSAAGDRRADPPGTKTFSKQRLQALLKDLFLKQKAELWASMMDARGQQGVDQGFGKRIFRREAEGDFGKKVLTLEQEDRLATFLGEVMICQNIPGLSLAVVRQGSRQSLGYGVADLEKATPVDKDTLFGIGSNTKAFSAAALIQLMRSPSLPPDKRFTLDTPLKDLMPELRMPDLTRLTEATVEDVLGHRTGLASGDLGLFAAYHQNVTAEILCSRLQYLPKLLPFRTAWYYSNTAFVVVTRLCETRANKSWADLVSETIFQPLQMNSTLTTTDAMSGDNVAFPYILRMREDDMFVQQDERLFDLRPLDSAGAIMSSSKDMTSWLSYLLDVLNRPSTLLMRMQRQMFQDRILLPAPYRQYGLAQKPEPFLHVGYGLGFFTSYYKGEAVHWHTGDLHGYKSHLLLLPGWDSAVYLGVNGPGLAGLGTVLTRVAYFVLELVQGRDPWVNVTSTCPEGWGSAKTTPAPDPLEEYDYNADDTQVVKHKPLLRPADDYVGVYSHGLLGDLVVTGEEEVAGGDTYLSLQLGRLLVADLVPTSSEFVFTLAARPPLANTDEFAKEHRISFKPSPAAAATSSSSSSSSKSTPSPTPLSRNVTSAEKEPAATVASKPPLTEVNILWDLELYTFKKGACFSDLPEEEGGKETDGGEGCSGQEVDGSLRKKEGQKDGEDVMKEEEEEEEGVTVREENAGAEDNIPNATASSVAATGDAGSGTATRPLTLTLLQNVVVVLLVLLALLHEHS